MRRLGATALGGLLLVLTAGFALRWVDVATREVAAIQAVVPVLGVGVVVVTLLALVLRYRRLALVGAVPSLVAVVLAAASLGAFSGGRPSSTDGVTVLSSNLEFGGGSAADVMAAVRARHADVVVLVEVTPAAVRRFEDAGLATELPYVVGRPEAGTTGALIRSRWPLTLLDEGKGYGGSLFWEPYALVQRPAGAFRVKAVHTREPILAAAGWREDLTRLRDWQLAQSSTEPLVMAGDFNASLAHPAFRSMLEGLVDAHRAVGAGWVRTWPQGRRIPPFVQLDHVVVRGFVPVDAGVVPVRSSDHAAVWATLTTTS